jgi:hypothetical protein
VSILVLCGASGVSAESPPLLEAPASVVESAPESVASEDDESPPQPVKFATTPQPSTLTIANQPHEAPNLRMWTYSSFFGPTRATWRCGAKRRQSHVAITGNDAEQIMENEPSGQALSSGRGK